MQQRPPQALSTSAADLTRTWNERSLLLVRPLWLRLLGAGAVLAGGGVSASALFVLVLPALDRLAQPPRAELMLLRSDTLTLAPPEPEDLHRQEDLLEEPEDPPEPLEIEPEEAPPPLSLEQLSAFLDPGFGSGSPADGVFARAFSGPGQRDERDAKESELFSIADLEQPPRVVFQAQPTLSSALRSRTPGEVKVIFVVDAEGVVHTPRAQASTDPMLEGPAVDAVKRWRFEPGRRGGQAVSCRMRVSISFPRLP